MLNAAIKAEGNSEGNFCIHILSQTSGWKYLIFYINSRSRADDEKRFFVMSDFFLFYMTPSFFKTL